MDGRIIGGETDGWRLSRQWRATWTPVPEGDQERRRLQEARRRARGANHVTLRGSKEENLHFENGGNHGKFIPMNTAAEIHVLAMKLPQRSRLKLAGELLRSVASTTAPEDLLHEAIRRDSEMEDGTVAALSESEFWSGVSVRRNPS